MEPINSSKNKLNNKISWLFNLEPNTHKVEQKIYIHQEVKLHKIFFPSIGHCIIIIIRLMKFLDLGVWGEI